MTKEDLFYELSYEHIEAYHNDEDIDIIELLNGPIEYNHKIPSTDDSCDKKCQFQYNPTSESKKYLLILLNFRQLSEKPIKWFDKNEIEIFGMIKNYIWI